MGAQADAGAGQVAQLLVRSARLVQELHRLQERYGVVWERVRVDEQEVRPSGPPFVFQPDLGMFAPLDDEHAALPDALYRREDADWVDRDGRRWSVQRLLRVPRVRVPVALPVAVGASAEGGASGAVSATAQASGGERARWTLLLHEAPAERIPARGQCGAAWSDWGATDRLLPLRRVRVVRRRERRRAAWLVVEAAVRAHGGRMVRAAPGPRAEVEIDEAGAAALAALPDLARVERAAVPQADDTYGSAFDATTLCTGLPENVIGTTTDSAECIGFETRAGGPTPVLMVGHQAAVTAAQAYLDEGWTGAGARGVGLDRSAAGGLAPWAVQYDRVAGGYAISSTASYAAVYREVPHLVIGTVEEAFLPAPAFAALLAPEPRVLVVVDDSSGATRVLWGADVRDGRTLPSTKERRDALLHGTETLAVALGNLTDGTDGDVRGREDRAARSGIARHAMGVTTQAGSSSLALLDALVSTEAASGVEDWADMHATEEDGLGLDVITDSVGQYRLDQGKCLSTDEARGLGIADLAVVEAYCESSVVYVHSAGNTNTMMGGCALPTQASPPSASPAALSVGAIISTPLSSALKEVNMSASQRQSRGQLFTQTAIGTTLDGRTVPTVSVHASFCGTTGSIESFDEWPYGFYQFFGATSAAAPQVAGMVLLFKHWYLDRHGASFANQPGRLISNVLNFADSSLVGASVPASGWGLGVMRMRLFERGYMGPNWKRSTTTVVLDGLSGATVIALGRGDEGGWMADASRLRITAWWLEVNTGAGETKADVLFQLYGDDSPLTPVYEHVRSADQCVVRIEYDCYSLGTYLPGRKLFLYVGGRSEPEVRFPHRSSRTIHISYFWESGPDPSLIDCGAVQACPPEHADTINRIRLPSVEEALATHAQLQAQVRAYTEDIRPPRVLDPSAGR